MASDDPLRMVRFAGGTRIVEKITGERPHVGTLHRWASRGLKGVKLRTAYAGGCRRTTEEWIREFFDAVTEAANGEQSQHSQPSDRDVEAAEKELAEAGI